MPSFEQPLAHSSDKVLAVAHPNIALVKYWGKRDVALNLPAVGSLSITLDTFETRTTVARLALSTQDEIVIGKELLQGDKIGRHRQVFDLLRAKSARPCGLRLYSENNFPTGAGLASSASGFAALTLAAARALDVSMSHEALAHVARQGSGSAPRSLDGGFVEMARGTRADGTDCHATQLYPAEYFPLRVVIAIFDERPKSILSTEGMLHTQKTSPFYGGWLASQERDLEEARAALRTRDFARLAEVSEHSCLKMHALAMASRPGLRYWLAQTYAALDTVVKLRAQGTGCFFTIDAGPQLKAVCLPEAAQQVHEALMQIPGVKKIVTVGLGGGARIVDAA